MPPPEPRPPPRPPSREAGRPTAGAPPPRDPCVHRLYARAAWTTLDALPLVAPRTALGVESRIIALCRRLDVEPLEVRARAGRVDLLFRFKPVHAVADVAEAAKRESHDHLERRGSPARWGRGVAVTTVDPAEVRSLMRRMALLTGEERGRALATSDARG